MPDAKIRWTADAKQAIAETKKLQDVTEGATSKMGSSIGGLKTSAVAAWVAVAGAVLTAKKAFEFGREGAEILELKNAGKALAASYGLSMDSIVAAIKRGASGTISELDAIGVATRVLNLGVAKSEKEFQQMAMVAETLGDRLNKSTEQSMIDVAQALTVLNARTLASSGITADADAVYAAYAEKLGKSVKQLTDAEKRTALLEDATRRLSGGTASAADEFDRLESNIADASNRAKEAVGGPLGKLVGWYNEQYDILQRVNEAAELGIITDGEARKIRAEVTLGLREETEVIAELDALTQGYVTTILSAEDAEARRHLGLQTAIPVVHDYSEQLQTARDHALEMADASNAAVDVMNEAWGRLDPDPLGDIFDIAKMAEWRAAGGEAVNEFVTLLQQGAIAGVDVTAGLEEAAAAAIAVQLNAKQIDLTEAKAQAKDYGVDWAAVERYIGLSGDGVDHLLAQNGKEVTIAVTIRETTIKRNMYASSIYDDNRQHGGPLGKGPTLVGEAGPELIIGGVVIPAGETRRLLNLGMLPGRKMQGGGKVFYPEYKGAPETQSLVRHHTSGSGKAPQGQEAWRPAQMAQVAAAVASQATAAAVGAVGGQIAAVQLAQAQEIQRQATQQAAADAEQNRLLREIADAVRATGTPGQVGQALSKEMQTFQAGG